MNTEDFEKKMDELKTPSAGSVKPPMEIKLAIVNAQRSATLGIWFVVIPFFFIAFALLKYELNINLGLLDTFEKIITTLDRNPATWWIQPVLLIGLPIAGIVLNILAITHFKWEPSTSLLTVSIKLRWINILVLAISLLIIFAFLVYLIGENFQLRAKFPAATLCDSWAFVS